MWGISKFSSTNPCTDFTHHMGIFIVPSFVKAQNLGARLGFSSKKIENTYIVVKLKQNCSPKNNVIIQWTISILYIVFIFTYITIKDIIYICIISFIRMVSAVRKNYYLKTFINSNQPCDLDPDTKLLIKTS